jgi:hypothetical protein
MHEETPGLIVATLDVRSHRASLNINYNQWGYSLNYSDSSNLNYDGTNIHPNYNKWTRSLNMAIQSELNSLPHRSLSSPANQSLKGVTELKPNTA